MHKEVTTLETTIYNRLNTVVNSFGAVASLAALTQSIHCLVLTVVPQN